MAFTAPSTDLLISEQVHLFVEIAWAISERFKVFYDGTGVAGPYAFSINGTSTAFPVAETFSGSSSITEILFGATGSSSAARFFLRARDNIENMLFSHIIGATASRFVHPDTQVLFTSMSQILTAAGYAGGWTSLAGFSPEVIKAAVVQLQDVLSLLTVIRQRVGVTSLGTGTQRIGIGPSSAEEAWDAARAASPEALPVSFGVMDWHVFFTGTPFPFFWRGEISYSGLSYTAGPFLLNGASVFAAQLEGTRRNNFGIPVTIGNTAGSDIVLTPPLVLSSFSVELDTALIVDGDSIAMTFSIETAEPTNLSGTGPPHQVFCSVGTIQIYADITPALTYG